MSLTEIISDHWVKGSAFLAIVLQNLLAFQKDFAEISLGTRFFIGGLSGFLATLSVAEISRMGEPNKRSIGVIVRVILLLFVCLLSVFLLREVATFHNVLLLQNPNLGDEFVGSIEIQPAHRAATLTINLATSQSPPVKIVDIAPASWNNNDPVEWRMQNQTPFGMTLVLQDFRSPQVFGIWYKLSASAQELDVDVSSDPAEVRVIRGRQLQRYRRNISIFGGLLCVIGLVFWSYRSSWFRPTI